MSQQHRLSIELQSPSDIYSQSPGPKSESTSGEFQRKWYHYLPLCGTVLLILGPHPSLLYVLVFYNLQTLHDPVSFTIHLLATYTLTFLIFSSLIVCTARDPGRVNISESSMDDDDDNEMGMSEALMSTRFDSFEPGRWCRKCWAPKPERTHHCGYCGRCVLKMDHHCPWLGSRCIGHNTYPAFLHFLLCVTLLSLYIAVMSIFALKYAFANPQIIDETTPIHEILLAAAGIIFTFVIGSFFCYHVYLVLTNQTTLENLAPFLLLRYLPPLPRSGHSLSDPPLEPELSYSQRRLVKDAHNYIRIYDIGWRKNVAQTLGWKRPYGWMYRLLYGGASNGDGKTFPRNPHSDGPLARLADLLVKEEQNR